VPRHPTLTDDGRAVVLDLHGARVDEAESMIRSAARLAAGRGRSTLRVVHGASTSDALDRNRTIKHALYALLDGGQLRSWVSSIVRGEGYTLLGLAAGSTRDPRPLQLRDVRPA